MKLRAYPKYKESGVLWTSEIPEGWSIHKIKFLLSVPITDGPHESPEFIEEGIPFLSVDSIQEGEIIFEGCRYISKEDHIRYKIKCNPKKNDIFMGKAASIGKIARVKVDFPFNIWSPLALLRTNQKINPAFFEYALKSDYSQDQIDIFATSNTQKNISMDDIPRIQIINPKKEEQNTIINFLDSKTSQLNQTIEKDRQLISLLKEKRIALINHLVTKGLNPKAKMKDTRIEWIGEVPEAWEIKKIKYFTIEKRNKVTELDKVGYFIGLENIETMSGKMISYNSTENIEGESLKFKKNQVLFCKLRPYLAKVIVADVDGFCTSELIIYECDKKISPIYLKYRLLSNNYIDYINSLTEGVKMPRADPILLSNIKLPLPSLSDQTQIAKYLDKATSKIDQTIQKIEEKITLMEEFKKSLIHHVVTGKVDVRRIVA